MKLQRAVICWVMGVGCWVLGLASCQPTVSDGRCLLPDSVQLEEGDIVFRRGGGIESHAVMMIDNEGEYSHVGIVVDTLGRKMIVHAVPGEPDFKGDVDRVKLDSVEKFFAPTNAIRGAVSRPKDSISARRAARRALAIYRRGVLFDHDYDMSDTTRLYCTELVLHVFSREGVSLVSSKPSHVELPMLKADVYYPSDIYQSAALSKIIFF